MELNSRLESLKASDLEAFLDASLAALRLIQNILQHPLNERYRRLRGTAPILKHKGVTDILEAAGFRLEDAQLVLPEMLLRSVNIEQHLTSCKYDIMAARRATGRKMGWEVPQNCIRVTAMSGISSYGELYDGMMDDKKVTIKMLQQMEVENLRDQFSGEIEILTQLKHPNVVELMGLVITAEPPSMILENLSESMLEVLHRDGLRKERIWGYLNQVVQGMEYIHSNGIIHCSLAARNMFLDAYDTVKIGDFSQSKKVSQLQSVEDIHNPFNVRWMAPEVLQENKWSKEADVWSFGIVMYEFLTSGSVPYADLNNEQVCSKVVGGYRLPRPQTCPAEFHQLMEQCCLRSAHDRPSFQELYSDHMPVLLEVLKRAPATSGNSQSSAAKSTIVDQKGAPSLNRKAKEPSLNTILNKNGNLVRVFVGMVSPQSSVVVCCLPKTSVQEAVTLALQKCKKYSGVDSKFCKVVALSLSQSAERPYRVLRRDTSILAAKKEVEMPCQFVIFNTRSDPYQSERTIVSEVLAAKNVMQPQFELRLEGHLILNEEVNYDDYGRKTVMSSWKKIWCVVHEGTMFLYQSKEDEKLTGYWQQLSLNECRIQVIYENKKKISGFSLHFPSGRDFVFSSEYNDEMDIIEWIEAITTGRHLSPSPLLKESSDGVVIHAGVLSFHQYLDVGKVRMNRQGLPQRETRAKTEEGTLDEGQSWVILHNNGMVQKVAIPEDGNTGKSGPRDTLHPEEWFSFSDVDLVEYTDIDNLSNLGYIIKINLPPSRFILKSESLVDHSQWVNAIRSVLAKSGREDVVSVMTISKIESLQRKRGITLAAKEVFRKPSVDFYTTYYIDPEDVMYSSSGDSTECLESMKHRTSGASSDSGFCVNQTDYLEVLPVPPTKEPQKSTSDASESVDLITQLVCGSHRKQLFLPKSDKDTCPLNPEEDDSDLYCYIDDVRRPSHHIYASISEMQQLRLEGEMAAISEGKGDNFVFGGPDRQPVCSIEEEFSTHQEHRALFGGDSQLQNNGSFRREECTLPPDDHTHLQSDSSMLKVDECTLPPDDHTHLESSDHSHIPPALDVPFKKVSDTDTIGSMECPLEEDLPQEGSEEEIVDSCTSPLQLEDDYVPMKSAACSEDNHFHHQFTSPGLHRELTPSPIPQLLGFGSPPLPSTPPPQVPPPLPPRNYPTSKSPEMTLRSRSMRRDPSSSSLESVHSADSDSPRLQRGSSFRTVKSLLGSFLNSGSASQLHKDPEGSSDKKQKTVYKTAELCDNNGRISLFGTHRPRKKNNSYDGPPTFSRIDGSRSPLLFTNRGNNSNQKRRPPISNVFDINAPLSPSGSVSSLTDFDPSEGIPYRTSSCSGRIVMSGSTSPSTPHRVHTALVRSKSARSCNGNKISISSPIVSSPLRSTLSSPHCHIDAAERKEFPTRKEEGLPKQDQRSVGNFSVASDTCDRGRSVFTPKSSTDSVEVEMSCSVEEATVPPGWEKAMDSTTGKEYYFNRDVGMITWNLTEVEEFVKATEKEPGVGWQPVVLADGRRYFYHTATKRSTWNIKDTFEQQQQQQQQQQQHYQRK